MRRLVVRHPVRSAFGKVFDAKELQMRGYVHLAQTYHGERQECPMHDVSFQHIHTTAYMREPFCDASPPPPKRVYDDVSEEYEEKVTDSDSRQDSKVLKEFTGSTEQQHVVKVSKTLDNTGNSKTGRTFWKPMAAAFSRKH